MKSSDLNTTAPDYFLTTYALLLLSDLQLFSEQNQ